MVAYSFQKRFITPILSGRKAQTIRAVGKRRHARPGDFLQLYSGMRTKHCRLILVTACTSVRPIWIDTRRPWSIHIDGALVTELEAFAQSDGFESLEEMQHFWRVNHPDVTDFHGFIIAWRVPTAVVEMGTNLLEAA